MSRLHECKARGADKVPSDPHWAGLYPTVGDRMNELYLKAFVSERAGTRNKTKRKTAQAQGSDFRDVRPWKVRNSGIVSAKSKKTKEKLKISKMAAEQVKGEVRKV